MVDQDQRQGREHHAGRPLAALGGHAERHGHQRQQRQDHHPRQPTVELGRRLVVAAGTEVAPELGLGALAHRFAALAERLARRQQVAVDPALLEALDRHRPIRLLEQAHAVIELEADAVTAGPGHELPFHRGGDLDPAARAAPLDEHAAQVAAVGVDLAGTEGRALAGVDEAVLLDLGVPAGLHRVVHREPVAVAGDRLHLAVQIGAERNQQRREREVRRGDAGDRAAGAEHDVELAVVRHAGGGDEDRRGEGHRQGQAEVVRHQVGHHHQHAGQGRPGRGGEVEQAQQPLQELRHQERRQHQQQRAEEQAQRVAVEPVEGEQRRSPGNRRAWVGERADQLAGAACQASRRRATRPSIVAESSATAGSSAGGPGQPVSAKESAPKLRLPA